jgi:hypothetical protein
MRLRALASLSRKGPSPTLLATHPRFLMSSSTTQPGLKRVSLSPQASPLADCALLTLSGGTFAYPKNKVVVVVNVASL